jgi:PPM family protein phosphatase
MISYHGKSDRGLRRSHNEDSILTSEGLFLLCDGMGGRKSGQIASRLAIETIARVHRESFGREAASSLADGDFLKTAIQTANAAIRQMAASSEEHTGMGTTVVAVMIDEKAPKAAYASVGDSRLYLLRSGTISQLSRDDSWVDAVGADTIDTATAKSLRHVLTKALGTHDVLDFDVKQHAWVDGDTLLLCSDGLSNMLTDREISGIVTTHGPDLEAAARTLIASANAAGGRDNISAVLVRYSG